MNKLGKLLMIAAMSACMIACSTPSFACRPVSGVTIDKIVLRKVPVYDENNAMLLYTVVYYTDGTHEFVRAPGYTGPLPNW